jgi:hypothetical protein
MKDKKFINLKEFDKIIIESFFNDETNEKLITILNLKAENWHKYKLKKLLDKTIIEINKPKKK